METPAPEEVRRTLAQLDARHEKIVAGMLALMVKNPDQVRDREWIAQQLTELTLMAGGFEVDTPDEGVRAVQEFLTRHADELLRSSFLLFQRVGLDLAPRAAEGFTFEDALQCGLGYLPSGAKPVEGAQEEVVRDMGEQPLARLMAEGELKPKDLVAASTEQVTHKMVTRAMKGRRLTTKTMGKVQRAWNKAAVREDRQADLFNYRP